jgi:TetR/AcrR family transcriptional repressor of nem operon
MRLTKRQIIKNRKRIVDAAAYLFRRDGFDAVGLADLMKSAGFTHGGFYNHFSSKDALVEEACRASFDSYTTRLAASLDASPEHFVQALKAYLSLAHRDDPGNGCPTASLVADVQRQSACVQAAFAAGVNRYAAILGKHLSKSLPITDAGSRKATARERSLRLLSEIVGAMMLSRAVKKHDPALSKEIINASRAHAAVESLSGK